MEGLNLSAVKTAPYEYGTRSSGYNLSSGQSLSSDALRGESWFAGLVLRIRF